MFIQIKNKNIRDEEQLISPLSASKNAIILDDMYTSFSEVIAIFIQYIIKVTKDIKQKKQILYLKTILFNKDYYKIHKNKLILA